MTPSFWKLSQSPRHFDYSEIVRSIEDRLVYVHQDTRAKGRSSKTQAELFVDAVIGDYFYLTHGNEGIYLLGQLTGPPNSFSRKGDGWLDRPFRMICPSTTNDSYEGSDHWWAPNHNSTFSQVKPEDLAEFEETILEPHFGIRLADYGIEV